MANYTIELRDIVENGINIFDFPYEFYDEKKRLEFERKFIQHFYFREIGQETIDRFKFYLRDKMDTVFPYYNELFKSASIEYDVLDNYKLTETYTRNVETDSKQSGISSTVGRTADEQTTENTENRNVNSEGTVNTLGSDTDKETSKTTTDTTGNVNNESSESVSSSGTSQSTNNEKYLDTPQGLTDLTDSKYISSLKQNTESGNISNSENKTSESGTENIENVVSESERNKTFSNTLDTNSSSNETTDSTLKGRLTAEHTETHDNNTRNYLKGETAESYTLTRRGNIGVDTDSDAIEKHNRLQRTLRNIEKMFFDECEDLFMLVF